MRSRNSPGSDFLLCVGDKRPNLSGVSLRLLHVWIRAESAGNTKKQKCAEAAWVTGTENRFSCAGAVTCTLDCACRRLMSHLTDIYAATNRRFVCGSSKEHR